MAETYNDFLTCHAERLNVSREQVDAICRDFWPAIECPLGSPVPEIIQRGQPRITLPK